MHAFSTLLKMIEQLRYYLTGQASSLPKYILEQLIMVAVGWVPTCVGIGLRAIAYRLIMNFNGMAAIENDVRIAYASNVNLGKGVYLDTGVYLHALPNGITIGDGTFIMHHTMLHVFNFRNLPQAGITIGQNCFIGEFNVVRGQGGVSIGNDVYTGPMVKIVAVNHVYDDPNRLIREQGITAQGIVIEDDVWLGAGVTVVDGVALLALGPLLLLIFRLIALPWVFRPNPLKIDVIQKTTIAGKAAYFLEN